MSGVENLDLSFLDNLPPSMYETSEDPSEVGQQVMPRPHPREAERIMKPLGKGRDRLKTSDRAAADWREDLRRCSIYKDFPDGYVVISVMYPVEVNIVGNEEVKVSSVWIDHTVLPARPGMAYDYSIGSAKEVLPALARGKRLKVFVHDKAEPVVDLNIGNGKKAVAFLRECDMYWTNVRIAENAWGEGRASAEAGEYGRATRNFDQALQKLPREYVTMRAKILYERGQAKLRKGDKTGGNADIRAATKLRRWIATMDGIDP